MRCPHCRNSFHGQEARTSLGGDRDSDQMFVDHQICPSCGRRFAVLLRFKDGVPATELFYPKATLRGPLSADVPAEFGRDYMEACLVFGDSPKASAALSRRCLQLLLRQKAGVKPQDLSREIDELLASKQLPAHLAEAVDAIRAVGNFAAHPIKSTSTGSIVDVEPVEAEWLLDVLEGLFDFYFVLPAATQRKKDAVNKKLADAGKPALK